MENNHSWSNGDMNHQNAYFGNSRASPESSEMKHLSGIAMYWSAEEQAILEDALLRYSSSEPYPSISRYAKIASELQHKTVRDVAMRCRWINKKRRKEDHNGWGRASVGDNKEIDMVVASNSAPHLLTEEDRIIIEHLKQNELFLNQIYANLASPSKLEENLTLFYKTRENIKDLLKNLHENAPEPMKRMPWPEKLSVDHDELLDSIILHSASQNQPWPETLSGDDHDNYQKLLDSIFLPSTTSPKQPWPEKLSDDHDDELLLDSILDLSTSPKQQLPEKSSGDDHDQLLESIVPPSTSPKQP
ncbi:hypothetical protein Bca52824_008937 [Brassica carinata]|uniref:Uncharacterized protein n=1 Tax=Brassica carinata TaxID=52824 RepID=A0A8X7WAT7_BRACI|nr:hypothetical protein Bca52824_008937 [Brassica carinata]